MLEPIPIIGGGPAGAAAALALRRAGTRATVYEKSSFPRHKVCGEFLSPEILACLEHLGVAGQFLAQEPARVTHAELYFSGSGRRFALPEPAYGLSRYVFDELLFRTAVERGAEIRRERITEPAGPAILAAGRRGVDSSGRRIFGFKAHFSGCPNDAVELYFFPGGYCGLCPIERGFTNVCGVAAESLLNGCGFRLDILIQAVPPLAKRLALLNSVTRWYITGPLRFGPSPATHNGCLAAGDASCFVDPFSGSGLLGAMQTGVWSAEAALQALERRNWMECRSWYRSRCSMLYRRQLTTTTIIRRVLQLGWAEHLAAVFPGSWLFRLTRLCIENRT